MSAAVRAHAMLLSVCDVTPDGLSAMPQSTNVVMRRTSKRDWSSGTKTSATIAR